jgi:hypothetical protein
MKFREKTMSAHFGMTEDRPSFVHPVLIAGLVSGILDLSSAFIIYGMRVPLVIAAGLIGLQALQGGSWVYILGIALHFLIATAAAGVYYGASRALEFLVDHPVVCGLFYGIAVFLVMNLIVLPLCAIHGRDPFPLGSLIRGLLIHMFCIGLPIALCIRLFSRRGYLTNRASRGLSSQSNEA